MPKLNQLIIARIVFSNISSLFFLTGATMAVVKVTTDEFVSICYMLCSCFFVFSTIIEVPIYFIQDTPPDLDV
jgi:hypothetical protein